MKRNFQKAILLLLCQGLLSSPVVVEAEENSGHSQQEDFQKADSAVLHDEMRKLWTDQVTWTRNYITSSIDGLPDQNKLLERLMQNQVDIGNAIKPFYGEDSGNKLAQLLSEHVLLIGKILDAAKSNNQVELKSHNTEWYQNADDIANLLSGLNANWSLNVLRDMLHTHLQLVTDVLDARLNKDWDADFTAFDKGIDHIWRVADVISDGVIKQYPDQLSE
ncbi:glycosyltransferase [Brevibacillus nitrificans]|uniref:Glycosyltransferase n=1 Tax=Brevibacillus nitrificans TaxID=651560 RepID=A0A3M8CX23_9BACL|nr:glycosyltransferase [Brevibacillus nitrificans]RNB79911.1 glycosyltransferase [Brevibacillus nitrificans]